MIAALGVLAITALRGIVGQPKIASPPMRRGVIRMLDLSADPARIAEVLQNDPLLGPHALMHPGTADPWTICLARASSRCGVLLAPCARELRTSKHPAIAGSPSPWVWAHEPRHISPCEG